jgi:hypothetical protein
MKTATNEANKWKYKDLISLSFLAAISAYFPYFEKIKVGL